VPVKRRCCRQHNKAASIDQYRRYSPYRLEQYTCERESNRVTAEDDEAKDAVDPPLQLAWDQGQPVAELDNAINAHDSRKRGCHYGEPEYVGSKNVEWEQQGHEPYRTDCQSCKAESFLKQAADTVFEQTYPNIECIIVDNASTDCTAAVLLDISTQYPGAKIVRRKDNGGQSLASMEGFAASSGEYVVFLDADDYLLATVGTQQGLESSGSGRMLQTSRQFREQSKADRKLNITRDRSASVCRQLAEH